MSGTRSRFEQLQELKGEKAQDAAGSSAPSAAILKEQVELQAELIGRLKRKISKLSIFEGKYNEMKLVAEDKAALIETMRIGAKIQVEQFLIVNEEKKSLATRIDGLSKQCAEANLKASFMETECKKLAESLKVLEEENRNTRLDSVLSKAVSESKSIVFQQRSPELRHYEHRGRMKDSAVQVEENVNVVLTPSSRVRRVATFSKDKQSRPDVVEFDLRKYSNATTSLRNHTDILLASSDIKQSETEPPALSNFEPNSRSVSLSEKPPNELLSASLEVDQPTPTWMEQYGLSLSSRGVKREKKLTELQDSFIQEMRESKIALENAQLRIQKEYERNDRELSEAFGSPFQSATNKTPKEKEICIPHYNLPLESFIGRDSPPYL